MKIIRIILTCILFIAAAFIIYWAIQPDNSPEWSGFGTYNEKPDTERYKTLWDWLDLIIIPASIALFAWIYTEFEKDKNTRIEEEKAREKTLDYFINTMTELLVKHDLAGSPEQKRLAIARTRINLALPQLDGGRKGQILQFLYESDLVDKNPKFKLLGCNFNESQLDNIVLGQSEIKGAYFKDASFKKSNLIEVDFTSCDFTGADFTGSLMTNTNLSYAKLNNTKLENVDLTTVDFEGADLTSASLKGSKIKRSQLEGIFKKEKIKLNQTTII